MKFRTLLLCLCFAGMARADEEINPTPRPPYVNPVPDYGHWTVTFKYPTEPPKNMEDSKPETPPAPAPVPPVNKIDIIKTGDTMLVTVYTPTAPPKIFYQRGEWIATLNPENPQQAQVLVPSTDHLPYPFYTEGFMLMEGIVLNADKFKGLVKYSGVPAYDYQTPEGEVWIAPTTMFPIAVKSSREGLIAEYQFFQEHPSSIRIPGDQAALLQKEQKAYKAVQSMR